MSTWTPSSRCCCATASDPSQCAMHDPLALCRGRRMHSSTLWWLAGGLHSSARSRHGHVTAAHSSAR